MDIHIDEHSALILIRLIWRYIWDDNGFSPWSYVEKKEFHHKADDIIWQKLGNILHLKVRGTSDFAKKHRYTLWSVHFDIQWVLCDEHWTVTVKKIDKGDFLRSAVLWNKREIKLDSNDLNFVCKRSSGKQKIYQRGLLHEFGHVIGNTVKIKGMHGDEYNKTSPYFNDIRSIMHSAEEIRGRHIDYILKILNSWIPKTFFEVSD